MEKQQQPEERKKKQGTKRNKAQIKTVANGQ